MSHFPSYTIVIKQDFLIPLKWMNKFHFFPNFIWNSFENSSTLFFSFGIYSFSYHHCMFTPNLQNSSSIPLRWAYHQTFSAASFRIKKDSFGLVPEMESIDSMVTRLRFIEKFQTILLVWEAIMWCVCMWIAKVFSGLEHFKVD